MTDERASSGRVSVSVGITAAALLILALKTSLQGRFAVFKLDDTPSIVLLVLAALPWLSQLLSSAKIGGQELIFREIEQQKVQVDQKLNRMLGLINNLVGEREVSLLRVLENSQILPYTFNNEAEKQDMRNQLRRLRTLGLISPTRSVSHIIDEKNNGKDIKADITVTNQGREFLNLE